MCEVWSRVMRQISNSKGSHARCLKPSPLQQLLCASPVELTGGPVTLSITLGLLSAILAQRSEVCTLHT